MLTRSKCWASKRQILVCMWTHEGFVYAFVIIIANHLDSLGDFPTSFIETKKYLYQFIFRVKCSKYKHPYICLFFLFLIYVLTERHTYSMPRMYFWSLKTLHNVECFSLFIWISSSVGRGIQTMAIYRKCCGHC